MSTKSEIETRIPEGYTVREAGKAWMIVGPLGYYRPVHAAEQVADAIAQIQAQVDKVSEQERADLQAHAPRTGGAVDRHGRRCGHSDTDNHGICYSCGAYVSGADAGRTLRRYGIVR